jgi:hypothetical protein
MGNSLAFDISLAFGFRWPSNFERAPHVPAATTFRPFAALVGNSYKFSPFDTTLLHHLMVDFWIVLPKQHKK